MYEMRLIDMKEAYPLIGYMWVATAALAYMVGSFIKGEVKSYFTNNIDSNFEVHYT